MLFLAFVKAKKISREEQNGVFVYFSSDPETNLKQMEKRNEIGSKKRLPDWIVAEILIETIRSWLLSGFKVIKFP